LNGALRVSEIYASVQGESTRAGEPCVFLRLTGCPLRCAWCDTAYAFIGGEDMAADEALQKALSFGLPLVEVTGGEPLAQAASIPLMEALLKAGLTVLLETSGALDISQVPKGVHRIVDVKCPGSGEETRNRWENLANLTPDDEVKFVLSDEADYQYAKRVMFEHGLEGKCPVLFSPVAGFLDPAQLADWMVRDRLRARLNLQLHKVLWPGESKGR